MCPFNTRTASIPDWWPTFSIKLSKRRLFAIRRRNEDPTRRSPSSSSKRKVFKETSWKRKLLPKISQTFPPLSASISILSEEEELEAKGFVYRYSWNQLFSYPNPNILCQSSHGSYWNYKSLISVLHYRQYLNLFKFNFIPPFLPLPFKVSVHILTQVWLNILLCSLLQTRSTEQSIPATICKILHSEVFEGICNTKDQQTLIRQAGPDVPVPC